MAESLTFNMDCMEAMKQFPDKYFDLAVVDPPYGDASSQTVNVEREREQKPWNRFGGRFDKYKTEQTRAGEELPTTGRNVGLCELAEHGRRSMQKNYFVGHCAGARIFRGVVPCLT